MSDESQNLPEPLQESDAPAILPVLHEPTRTELAQARKTYGEVIRSPTKSRRLVETVDFAVAEQVMHRSSGVAGVAAAP